MAKNDEELLLKQNGKIKPKSIVKPILFIILLWLIYRLCSNAKESLFSIFYFVLIIVNTVTVSVLMDPELINERANIAENTKNGDIFYALIVGRIGPLLIIVISGLDARFHWTQAYGASIKVEALIIMIAALVFTDWAVITNRYFSGVVRIQKERGHKVISEGPYRYVRHPGYLGAILSNLVTPLILNSIVGIIPAIIVIYLTLVRTIKEDDYLKKELDGYKDYSEKTKYRLVPYIW